VKSSAKYAIYGWIIGMIAGFCFVAIVAKGNDMPTPELFDSGVPRGASKLLAGWYQDAAGRLAKIVLNPPGGTEASRQYNAAFAAQRIDQIGRELKVKGGVWASQHIAAAFRDGRKLADKQAIEAGVRPKPSTVAGSFTLISTGAVQKFALDTISDLHRAADSLADRAKSVLRQTAQLGLSEAKINQVLAGGLIEGQPVQTIRKLGDELRAVHGETVEINGRNFDVRYYAEMVARTKTRQATVAARHERLAELDIDLVAIVGLISQNFCTAFLGEVFSLSGKSDKYPAYAELPGGGPPFHPNCSKSTRPFVEELASGKQLDQAEGLDDADKLLGMKPSEAQRSYKDLQIFAQQKDRYATTAKKLFG
jgi:hypothetical protein